MCHQRILLPFNLLYLRFTCTVSNADSVSWQMVFLTATALAAFRVPHTLLFSLTCTFSLACCERMGELSWEASLLLELPFSCSVLGLPLSSLPVWVGLERFEVFSFFHLPLLLVCPFPLPFLLLLLATWLCGPCPSFTTAVQGCSVGSEGCSAVQGDCSACL